MAIVADSALLSDPHAGAGPLLRRWRQHRRLSQLDLALRAETSARHLSFVETGRAQPDRTLLLRLAEQLEIPQRERNTLLVAAGYAPVFVESTYGAGCLEAVRAMIARLFRAHEPFPALALDADGNVVTMNGGARLLARELPEHLRQPPVNLMRLALHPDGLAGLTADSAGFRRHMLERLHRQAVHSGRPALRRLYEEVSAYAHPDDGQVAPDAEAVALLRVRALGTELRMFTTVTTFGAAADITVSELSLETFHPADGHTANAFRQAAPPPA